MTEEESGWRYFILKSWWEFWIQIDFAARVIDIRTYVFLVIVRQDRTETASFIYDPAAVERL